MVRKAVTTIAFSFLIAVAGIFLAAVPVRADLSDVDRIIASIPDDWPAAPKIQAESAILIDADSGEILYAKNATEKAFPASTTKLATALLTLENASLQDVVNFSFKAVSISFVWSAIAVLSCSVL